MCYINYENYQHKHIEEMHFTDSNGLVIYFTDNTHTYIDPYVLCDITNDFGKRWLKKYMDEIFNDEEYPDESISNEGE